MRRIMVSLFGAALAVGMLAGCGSEVDENKTPDQIKAEVKDNALPLLFG